MGIMEKFRRWLEEKGYEKWFRKDNLIVLALAGVLLFIIALPAKDAREELNEGIFSGLGEGEGVSKPESAKDKTREDAGSLSQEEYADYLEEKLEDILAGMDGVGKVEVMITLSSSRELVLEKDSDTDGSQTDEEDNQGGSRHISQTTRQETTVFRTEGNVSEPYVIKTLLPRVEGVVVVAEGAGNGVTDKSITEVVLTLFDVGAHKVKVVKMK